MTYLSLGPEKKLLKDLWLFPEFFSHKLKMNDYIIIILYKNWLKQKCRLTSVYEPVVDQVVLVLEALAAQLAGKLLLGVVRHLVTVQRASEVD